MKNIILHIPHSSTTIPFYAGYLIDENIMNNEINLLTDWFIDELFNLPFPRIVTPFSRIFCDVERFDDDSLELMSKYGMGMCYTHLDNGQLMRKVSPGLRIKIKSEYYDQHHSRLEQLTSETLAKYGQAIILDCHSFSDMPFNHDLIKEMPRPDFCIGIDEFHTSDKLRKVVVEYLTAHGYQVKINSPYSGTLIPMKYYHKDKNVIGIMIEVNKKLYMTIKANKVLKIENFNITRTVIQDLVDEICKY